MAQPLPNAVSALGGTLTYKTIEVERAEDGTPERDHQAAMFWGLVDVEGIGILEDLLEAGTDVVVEGQDILPRVGRDSVVNAVFINGVEASESELRKLRNKLQGKLRGKGQAVSMAKRIVG